MEKLTGLLLLLLAVINFAVAQESAKYFKTGGKLTLDLRPRSAEPITYILWKFNGELLAAWVDKVVPLNYYGVFHDRTVLDINTGRLEINKMTEADQGVYTVKVNRKEQSVGYKAMAIEDTNKPTVESKPLICSPASERCFMSCETDTTRTGPLIYSWKMDDGEWKEADQKLPINKAEHSGVKTFTCRVKNPLDVLMESDPEKNPLFKKEKVSEGLGGGVNPLAKDSSTYPLEKNPLFEEKVSGGLGGGEIAGIIGVLCLIGVVGLVVAWISKKWPFKNREVSNDTGTYRGIIYN